MKQHHELRPIDHLPCKLVIPEPPKEGPEGQELVQGRLEHRFVRNGMSLVANVAPGMYVWTLETSVVFAYMRTTDNAIGLAEYALRHGEWSWRWLTWAEMDEAVERVTGSVN